MSVKIAFCTFAVACLVILMRSVPTEAVTLTVGPGAGYDYRDLEDRGVLLVITKLEIRYKAPAQYDDVLELTTKIAKIDRVRIEHEYELVRPKDTRLIAQAKTTLVHVDRNGKIQPVPDFLYPEEQ